MPLRTDVAPLPQTGKTQEKGRMLKRLLLLFWLLLFGLQCADDVVVQNPEDAHAADGVQDLATTSDAETAAGACSCRVCETNCLGTGTGCAAGQFCEAYPGPARCVPTCNISKPECPSGTKCGMTMDCDVPLYVCR